MQYFSEDYLEFFKELAANNHKDWFDTNRKRYETVVREPFKVFTADLIKALSEIDPELDIQAKDAIFRINRDIRFSKDKTPYKLNNSALISREGRKDKNCPGVYLELGPEKLAFYGGVYMPDTKLTHKIRVFLNKQSSELNAILDESNFKSSFGEIHGDKSKRIPKELKEAADKQPLIMNKQWYYFAHMPPEVIIQDDLMQQILNLEKVARPLKDFLTRAVNS